MGVSLISLCIRKVGLKTRMASLRFKSCHSSLSEGIRSRGLFLYNYVDKESDCVCAERQNSVKFLPGRKMNK
jgi:hypothetical protein